MKSRMLMFGELFAELEACSEKNLSFNGHLKLLFGFG